MWNLRNDSGRGAGGAAAQTRRRWSDTVLQSKLGSGGPAATEASGGGDRRGGRGKRRGPEGSGEAAAGTGTAGTRRGRARKKESRHPTAVGSKR